MIKRIKLTKIVLQFKHNNTQPSPDSPSPKEYWISFRIKASFCLTQRKQVSQAAQSPQDQKIIFEKLSSLMTETEDQVIEIKIFKKQQEKITTLINLSQSTRSFLKNSSIILNKLSPEIEKLHYHIEAENIQELRFLELKNLLIELMPLVGKKFQMALQIQYNQDKYRVSKPHSTLFWSQTVRIYIQEPDIIKFRLIDQKEEKIELTDLKINLLKHQVGFRKNLITNEKNFPIGCLQFEYKTQGLHSIKQNLKAVQTQLLYKIELVKVKGKLKMPCQEVTLRIISDLNYFQSETKQEYSDRFELDIDNYIYSEEPKCNFMVICKRENQKFISMGTITLHMLGKFQRKINFQQLESHQPMGFLMVSFSCLKVETKALRFKNMCLKFPQLPEEKEGELYIKANVGGCFGNTQKKVVRQLMPFVKNLEVRYSIENDIQLQVVQANSNRGIPIEISLMDLENTSPQKMQRCFGNEETFAKGRINFIYEYFPKIDQQEELPPEGVSKIKNQTKSEQKSPQNQLKILENPLEITKKDLKNEKVEQIKIKRFQKKNNKPQLDQEQPQKPEPNHHICEIGFHPKQLQNSTQQVYECKPRINSHADFRLLRKSTKGSNRKSQKQSPHRILHSKESSSSKKTESKPTVIESNRFQHIVNIYLGQKQRALTKTHSRPKQTKLSSSSHRSSSHGSKKKSVDQKNKILPLPQIKLIGYQSGSSKKYSKMEISKEGVNTNHQRLQLRRKY